MQRLASSLQGALLNRAWIQWAALGIDATVERDDAVVDPEALIVLTAELGDADARLRDLSTDWCVTYGRYVNGSRLKQVARELGTPDDIDRRVRGHGRGIRRSSLADGDASPARTTSGATRPDSTRPKSRPRLRIRLRAAFGVNARADILAGAVGCVARRPQRRRPGSRHARFTKPSVASALDALLLAGLVTARSVGNERRFTLLPKVLILPGLRPPVSQSDWVARYAVALEVLRILGP